jgi:hypothetical protein
MQMRRGIAVVVAALMMVVGALPGLAEDRVTDERAPVEQADRPADRAQAQLVDQPVDRPSDRVTDRSTDRYRCVDFVTDRSCVDDRHPHVNIRHLIQRLINAGEWEKLFRLLHRLGII